MHPTSRTITLAVSALLIASACAHGGFGMAVARQEPKPAKSSRGGSLIQTDRHQIEVFFYPTGVRLFSRDKALIPIDASRLSGTATFYHPNSPQPWFERSLHSAPASAGQPSPSLDLIVDLTAVPPTGAKVAFEIAGLADPAERATEFTVPLELVQPLPESRTTNPTPRRGGLESSPGYLYGHGYHGFGYYPYPSPGITRADGSGPVNSLSGYGHVPAAGPGSPLPYLSGGHAVSILPSASGFDTAVGSDPHDWTTGRGSPLSRPWLRPMN